MELKYISKRKIHDIAVVKKFSYGSFEVIVTIDSDGPIDIIASEKQQEIVISAVNNEKALIAIESVYLSSAADMEKFMRRCKEAKELLELMNDKRQKLIEWEESE